MEVLTSILGDVGLVGAMQQKGGYHWLQAVPITPSCCLPICDRDVTGALQPGAPSTGPFHGSSHIRVVKHSVSTDAASAVEAVDAIRNQIQTRAYAGLPPSTHPATRDVLVIVNPNSGDRTGRRMFETRMRPLLDAAGLMCDIVYTTHAGHLRELGLGYHARCQSRSTPYEAVLIIGGDGTVHEFVNGFVDDALRRTAVAPTGNAAMVQALLADFQGLSLCSVACGTQNALSVGLRTQQPEYAAWCLAMRKRRPLDALIVNNGAGQKAISLCGVGWGVAGAIAADSEAWRFLGKARYGVLKVRHGAAAGLGVVEYAATVKWGATNDLLSPGSSAVTPSLAASESDDVFPVSPRVSETGVLLHSPPESSASTALSLAPAGSQRVSPTATAPEVLHECTKGCSTCTTARDQNRQVASISRLIAEAGALMVCSPSPSDPGANTGGTRASGMGPIPNDVGLVLPLLTRPAVQPLASQEPAGETGRYVTVGVVNTTPDARFGHASDGCCDLILARKGGVVDTSGLLMRYIGRFAGMSDERHSVLYDYIKTSAVCIQPAQETIALGCNVDGEAFPGPGPFRVQVLPSLFTAYGEL